MLYNYFKYKQLNKYMYKIKKRENIKQRIKKYLKFNVEYH